MIAKTYISCCAGDGALLPAAKAALNQIHDCGVLVNDLHPKNVVIRLHENQVHVFFVDFSQGRRGCLVFSEGTMNWTCRRMANLQDNYY